MNMSQQSRRIRVLLDLRIAGGLKSSEGLKGKIDVCAWRDAFSGFVIWV